jgi:hypothetical protein
LLIDFRKVRQCRANGPLNEEHGALFSAPELICFVAAGRPFVRKIPLIAIGLIASVLIKAQTGGLFT